MNDERLRPPVPDVTIERYRLHELPAEQMNLLVQRLSDDEELSERLLALERSDAEMEKRHLADRLIRRLPAREYRSIEPPHAALRVAVLAAVAVSALLMVRYVPWSRVEDSMSEAAQDGARLKGPVASLVVYRNTEAGSEVLSDQDIAREGDVIRVAYRVASPGFGAILSIDGRGVVTFHLPADGRKAEALHEGRTVLLDRAFELDDAPRSEVFYLITRPESFDLAPVVDAMRRASEGGARLELSPSFEYFVLTLRKEARP